MFYVIENKYVGPNKDHSLYVDIDTIEISSTPALTNLSHEPRIQGWCGTTNDWEVNAHGQYFSVEEARAAINEIFGDVRSSHADGNKFVSDDETVVEVYKPGLFESMNIDWTANCAISDGGIRYPADDRLAE